MKINPLNSSSFLAKINNDLLRKEGCGLQNPAEPWELKPTNDKRLEEIDL